MHWGERKGNRTGWFWGKEMPLVSSCLGKIGLYGKDWEERLLIQTTRVPPAFSSYSSALRSRGTYVALEKPRISFPPPIKFSSASRNKGVVGTSLVVHWLRRCAPNAEGPGSISCQRTTSHVLQLRVCMPQRRWKISCSTMNTWHRQI